MDIILNTNFNNPDLPVIPTPGFYDDFTTGSSTQLDFTSREARPYWFDANPWPVEEGLVKPLSRFALVEGYSTDGVLSTRVHTVADGVRAGLTARYDSESHLWIAADTQGRLSIYQNITGSGLSKVGNSTTPIQDGDILTVTLQGPSVNVLLNDTGIIQHNTSVLTGTQHGFFSFTPSEVENVRFEYLSFEV